MDSPDHERTLIYQRYLLNPSDWRARPLTSRHDMRRPLLANFTCAHIAIRSRSPAVSPYWFHYPSGITPPIAFSAMWFCSELTRYAPYHYLLHSIEDFVHCHFRYSSALVCSSNVTSARRRHRINALSLNGQANQINSMLLSRHDLFH